METISIETSSEEDDTYLNSVAKLKAMRKRVDKPELKKLNNGDCEVLETNEEKKEEPVEVVGAPETIIQGRAKKKKKKAVRRTTRGSRKQDDHPDSDLEIVSVENPMAKPTEEPMGNAVEVIGEETEEKNGNTSLLSEEEDYEIDIKVLWRSKDMCRLSIRRNESFEKIYSHFANLAGVTPREILLTRREKTVKRTETPAEIGLSVIDILEGGIVTTLAHPTEETSEPDSNFCVIRVQGADKHNSFVQKMRKNENFRVLSRIFAGRLEIDEKRVKFFFDGEVVDLEDTPELLDIEDEACFDVRIGS